LLGSSFWRHAIAIIKISCLLGKHFNKATVSATQNLSSWNLNIPVGVKEDLGRHGFVCDNQNISTIKAINKNSLGINIASIP